MLILLRAERADKCSAGIDISLQSRWELSNCVEYSQSVHPSPLQIAHNFIYYYYYYLQ